MPEKFFPAYSFSLLTIIPHVNDNMNIIEPHAHMQPYNQKA